MSKLISELKSLLTGAESERERALDAEHAALLARTEERGRAMSARMKAEGRHVLTGYRPPRTAHLARY